MFEMKCGALSRIADNTSVRKTENVRAVRYISNEFDDHDREKQPFNVGVKHLILRRTEQAERFAPEAKCNIATLVHMIDQTGLLRS